MIWFVRLPWPLALLAGIAWLFWMGIVVVVKAVLYAVILLGMLGRLIEQRRRGRVEDA